MGVGVSRPRKVSKARPSLSPAAFTSAVGKVREHITAGDVFQLVLSVRFEGECDLHPFQVYRALRLLNHRRTCTTGRSAT